MLSSQRLFLIGGASHVGKSTLAQSLASHLQWNFCSTDKLARHPGRPWRTENKEIPQYVARYYQRRSADVLLQDVLYHYRKNVWPLIEDIVNCHANDLSSERVVIEGSALLPELVKTLNFDNVSAVWLTASNFFLRHRIYRESQYETKSLNERRLIDKFLERNNLYNERIIKTARKFGLKSLNIEDLSASDDLMNKCLSAFQKDFPTL